MIQKDYGAHIERGKITEVCTDGYRVESYSRDGLITPPIPFETECAVGDWVYFFLFPDGRGRILGKF